MPKEIQGCSGVYAADEPALDKGRYLFVSDLQRAGYLRLKGVAVPMALVSSADEGRDRTYRSDSIEVRLKMGPPRVLGDEVWRNKGMLYIRVGNRADSVAVAGEEGC
ncbi:MAG TPA: hypothetical protein VHK69_22125 [Chitinophagaceae bacterium]|nr:hypothetical protein [Chitinophagaceae bacterium]